MRKNKPSVLIVTDEVGTGGTATFMRNILHELHSKHVSVTIISFREENEKHDYLQCESPIRHVKCNLKNTDSVWTLLRRVFFLLRFLWKNEDTFSVVLSDLWYAAVSVKVALWLLGRKTRLVYHFHSFYQRDKLRIAQFQRSKVHQVYNFILFQLEKYFLQTLEEIVVFSKYAKNLLVQQSVLSNKIIILPPGLNFLVKVDSTNGNVNIWETKKKLVAVVGRIEPRKGIHAFLQQLSKRESEFKNALFVVVSDFGSSHFNLFSWLSQNATFQDNVVFIHRPDASFLQRLYQQAHVVAFPSLEDETFGFVVIEALQNHTPVVAFDTGAPAEILDRQWLVPFDQEDRWSLFLEELKLCLKRKKSVIPTDVLRKKYSWTKYRHYLSMNKT